jgi:hypothetical protein
MSKKTNSGPGTGLAILGGLAAAAAAGVYFIYGKKELQKKAKKVRGWALKAKGEVLEKIEKMKAVDEKIYHDSIDAVMKKYEKVKSIDTTELAAVAKELKSHWKNIKNELQGGTKKVKKVVTKVAKDTKKAIV